MIEIAGKVNLRSFVPANDNEKIVLRKMAKNTRCNYAVMVWEDGWIEKSFWTIEEAAQLLNMDVTMVDEVIAKYDVKVKHQQGRKFRLNYGSILKIKFIVDHLNDSILQMYIDSGKLKRLYEFRNEYHVI